MKDFSAFMIFYEAEVINFENRYCQFRVSKMLILSSPVTYYSYPKLHHYNTTEFLVFLNFCENNGQLLYFFRNMLLVFF